MRFPLSSDLVRRLPRHPDWKYERVDGQAWLSPRPRPLAFRRPVDITVPPVTVRGIEVRPIDAGRDAIGIAELLGEVWADEDPYRSLEHGEAVLRAEIERTVLGQCDLEGAIAVGAGAVCAAALLTPGPSTLPTLTWLTVRRDARDQGLATALLGVVIDGLSARGHPELASATSAANVPSLRWHLTRGFRLAPDQLRETLRRDHP